MRSPSPPDRRVRHPSWIGLSVLSLTLVMGGCQPSNSPGTTAAEVSLTPDTGADGPGPQTPRPAVDDAPSLAETPTVEQGQSGLLQRVAPLHTTGWRRFERRWDGLRKMENISERARAIARSTIEETVCEGLTDMRALEGHGLPPFAWRDRVRGRTHASPVLVRTLVGAYEELRQGTPAARVTVGDLSQPGCGPLRHGVLVRDVFDRPDAGTFEATAALNRAALWAGDAVAWTTKTPLDYPDEAPRFTEADAALRVETRIIGQGRAADGALRLRTGTTRYRLMPPPSEEEVTDFFKEARQLVRRGHMVEKRATRSWRSGPGEAPRLTKVWRQRWVDPASRRQLTTVSTRRLRRRLTTRGLHEVRMARWQASKPGSAPGEVRWWPGDDGGWTRWQALYEAGHQTHVTGRDADIAYITTENRRHFAVDVTAIDARATWRWFQLLETHAAAAGVELDRILVAREVHRHLKSALTAAELKSPLWRHTVRIVSGHDAHHHVRITAPSRGQEASAREHLGALTPPAPPPSP